MRIAELSVKNSLLVNLLSVFVILAGTHAMFRMQREAFPAVDYDIVTVTTIWPGAPTEDVEKFVTIPLEEEISSISGLEEMDSSSDEGLSTIGITLDPGVKDKRKVVNDIQRAVDRVRNLPAGAEDPEVFELASREIPVIEISLSGGESEQHRREYAESLKDELLDLEGVSQVREIGWRDYEYWVEVDPHRLTEYHVSMQEIMDALRTRNVTVPGGQLKTGSTEFNVRTTGEFRTKEEIANVIIRANDSGNWLHVKDVASVKAAFEDPTNLARVNNRPASAMLVIKTEQADAIKVVDRVRELIPKFEDSLPDGMTIMTANDFSFYVKRRLGVLTTNGIIGFILVLAILFLFLDPIPAFMTAAGIPIALFATFIVMSLMGITINLVSMLGIILVLGMLVDDGIIVAENVYRYVEQGVPAREATIKGTTEVVAPVTITILTTFAAFGPMMFMEDILGKFIREIPKVVLITLTASLVEAFVILPSHLCDVLQIFQSKVRAHKERRWFIAVKNIYQRHLSKALQWRYGILMLLLLIFGFTIFIYKTQLTVLLFVGEGIEEFWVRAEAKKGTPLEKTDELLQPVNAIIEALPEHELESYRTYIGSIESERGFDPNAKRGTHLAQITVYLTPAQQRRRRPQEIVEEVREQLKEIDGFEKLYTSMPKEGPPTGADVEVGIRGEDYEVMEEIAKPYVEFLQGKIYPSGLSRVFIQDASPPQATSQKESAEANMTQQELLAKSSQIYARLTEFGYIDKNQTVSEKVDTIGPDFLDYIKQIWSKASRDKIKQTNLFRNSLEGMSAGEKNKLIARLKLYRSMAAGVSDVTTSYDFGKKQLKVIIDEAKAKKYFLTIGQIATTVRNVFKGGIATTIKPEKAEEEINVVVRFPEEERNKREVFEEILVPNDRGNLVKLSSVARVEESEGVYLINHFDGKRVLYVTAQTDKKDVTPLIVNRALQKEFPNPARDYLGYNVKYGGEFEDQMKSAKNLMTSYLFALFLIFILLVAMFRSLIQPFIVMIAIPFGIIGVILAFWIHDMILPTGRPVNFFALVGLVGLTGIVVNDSVVLMDFINRLRKEGKNRRESLIEAGLMRLRPVIMTSVTTIGGLISVAYGIGGGDPFLKPMALAIVWGLTFSTGLTLIGIPCIYAIVDDIAGTILHRNLVKTEKFDPDT
ncbi:MAG: efflux RND transporter permease subunit [Candidatus Omnitrophica bacterium]|nr:efflux RND transporter permease subunit [Candidatus Omnitrophota bacterium]